MTNDKAIGEPYKRRSEGNGVAQGCMSEKVRMPLTGLKFSPQRIKMQVSPKRFGS